MSRPHAHDGPAENLSWEELAPPPRPWWERLWTEYVDSFWEAAYYPARWVVRNYERRMLERHERGG